MKVKMRLGTEGCNVDLPVNLLTVLDITKARYYEFVYLLTAHRYLGSMLNHVLALSFAQEP